MKRNEFWLLAENATLDAESAQTENEKRVLLELARIWTQAHSRAVNRDERKAG